MLVTVPVKISSVQMPPKHRLWYTDCMIITWIIFRNNTDSVQPRFSVCTGCKQCEAKK